MQKASITLSSRRKINMEVNLEGDANGTSEVCVSIEMTAADAEAYIARSEASALNLKNSQTIAITKPPKEGVSSSKKPKSPETKNADKAAEAASTSSASSLGNAAKEDKKSSTKGKGSVAKKDVNKKAAPKIQPAPTRAVGLRKPKSIKVLLEVPPEELEDEQEDGNEETTSVSGVPSINSDKSLTKVEGTQEKNPLGKKTTQSEKVEAKKTLQSEKVEAKKTTQSQKAEAKKTIQSEKVEAKKTTQPVKVDGKKTAQSEKVDGKKSTQPVKVDGKKSTQPVKADGKKSTQSEKIEKNLNVEQPNDPKVKESDNQSKIKDVEFIKKEKIQEPAESCSSEEKFNSPAKIVTQRKSRKSPIQTRPTYDDMTLDPEFLGEEEVKKESTGPVQKSNKNAKNQKSKQGKKKEAPQKLKEEKPKQKNDVKVQNEDVKTEDTNDIKKEETKSEALSESGIKNAKNTKNAKNAKKSKPVPEKKETHKKHEEKVKFKTEDVDGTGPENEDKAGKESEENKQTAVAKKAKDDGSAMEKMSQKEEAKQKPGVTAGKLKKNPKNAKKGKTVLEEEKKKKETTKKPKQVKEESAMDEEEKVPVKIETKTDPPAKKQNKRKHITDSTENERKRLRGSGATENNKNDEDADTMKSNDVGGKKKHVNGKKTAQVKPTTVATNVDQTKPSTSKRRRSPLPSTSQENLAGEGETKELPCGWKRDVVVRKSGKTVGKADVYIYSPDGKKLRSRNDVKRYLESNPKAYPGVKSEDFDFCGNPPTTNILAPTVKTENTIKTEEQKPKKSAKKTSPKKNTNKESGQKVVIKMFSKNAAKK